MRPTGLIDTGAILAFINPRDDWHEACVDVFQATRFPLVTTAAVVTEVFHLVRARLVNFDAAWNLFDPKVVAVLPIDDSDMPRIQALMEQYADRPMDFADATLVRVAERESLTTIFTVDRDDFETYRIGGRRRFRIVPERRAEI